VHLAKDKNGCESLNRGQSRHMMSVAIQHEGSLLGCVKIATGLGEECYISEGAKKRVTLLYT